MSFPKLGTRLWACQWNVNCVQHRQVTSKFACHLTQPNSFSQFTFTQQPHMALPCLHRCLSQPVCANVSSEERQGYECQISEWQHREFAENDESDHHKIASRAHVLTLMQVCMAADEGLGAILPQQPPAVCLPLLKAHLPAQGTVNSPACQPTPLIHVSYHQHNCLCTVLAELDNRLASCIHSKAAGIHGGGRPSFLTSRASQSLACNGLCPLWVCVSVCVCVAQICVCGRICSAY